MCMSKPQRVLSYNDGKANVEFEGSTKTMRSPFPLKAGDYVLCQSGMVVKKVPEKDAKDMLREWGEMNEF